MTTNGGAGILRHCKAIPGLKPVKGPPKLFNRLAVALPVSTDYKCFLTDDVGRNPSNSEAVAPENPKLIRPLRLAPRDASDNAAPVAATNAVRVRLRLALVPTNQEHYKIRDYQS